ESEEDRAAIDSAVAILAKPQELFVLPKGAECTVTQASAGLESEEEHDEHEEHAEGEDEHDDHAKGEEEHDEHEEHAEGKDEHDEHDEASHTEFHAEYILTCGSPSAIDKIEFAYFEAFENARELEVQVITNSGAQAFEVERDEPTLNLRGMF
ncbi:MAG: ZrgA family zinc uptake protein, partial [Paracoccaceae bacterium]